MKLLSVLSYLVSMVFIGLGFYKMHVYYNSEIAPSLNENAYVGADAYNYIINSNYSTAYFTLATLFVILGSLIIIIDKLSVKQLSSVPSDNVKDQTKEVIVKESVVLD